MKWLDPFNDAPSWTELNEQVEAELNSGGLVVGIIEEYEMTPGPDEQPLVRLKTARQTYRWYDDIKRFRYLAPNAKVSGAGTASTGLPGYAGDNNGETT